MPSSQSLSKAKHKATYNAYLERLLLLLSKRIVWSINQENFDDEKWRTTFRKLHKNMIILEKSGVFEPRFSEASKSLAESLQITINEDDDNMDTLSRMSSHSISSRIRKLGETFSKQKRPRRPNSNQGHTSIEESHNEESKKLLIIPVPVELNNQQNSETLKVDQGLGEDGTEKFGVGNMIQDAFKSHSSNFSATRNSAKMIRSNVTNTFTGMRVTKTRPSFMVKKRPQTPNLFYLGSFEADQTFEHSRDNQSMKSDVYESQSATIKLSDSFLSKAHRSSNANRRSGMEAINQIASRPSFSNASSLNQSPYSNKMEAYDSKKWQTSSKKTSEPAARLEKPFGGFYLSSLARKIQDRSMVTIDDTLMKPRESYDISSINGLRATPNLNETPTNAAVSAAYNNDSKMKNEIAAKRQS